MSRTIAILGGDPDDRDRAVALANALGRRLVDGPTKHDDEVALLERGDEDAIDLALTAVLAPDLDADDETRALLDWAMEQGDVLTPWEHEQVMP